MVSNYLPFSIPFKQIPVDLQALIFKTPNLIHYHVPTTTPKKPKISLKNFPLGSVYLNGLPIQ